MVIAVLAALAAAASFAGAGILQQRAASRQPADEALSLRLLTDLARRPMWPAGIEPTVAIVIAVVLFGESVAGGWNLVIAGAGAVVVRIGIVLIDTSPVTHRMHKQRHTEAGDQDEEHGQRAPA